MGVGLGGYVTEWLCNGVNRKRDSKHKIGRLFPLGSFYNLSKQKVLELFQAGSDSHSSKNVAELIDQSMNAMLLT